ncbi:uncharacterized protein [Halyomorpha halys]|uniref:uncharacterized protein n=1 Tax=Halyomorpha halys TaxID=286706 RepID=UPI0006D4ED94|nr:general odorant-binding protein 19d-like [Halyomorpha halys]KAE8573826.1 Odorant-binding protein 40 [Halyomorpha halys]
MSRSILLFGIFLISAHLALSSYFPDEWEEDCKKENGFDGDITELNFTDPSSFPRPVKCYMACFMGKQQVMKPDGSFDFNHAKELYSTVYKNNEKKVKMFHRIVDECAKEYKDYPDKCETAFSYVKCKRLKYAAYNQ